MSDLLPILRRQLKSPLFALAVMLLVAAVVAVNATAFSAIHALRWKALPYADAEQLVELRANLEKFGFVVGLAERLRGHVAEDRAHFSGALGFSVGSQPRSDEAGRGWRLARVTPDFESVLGIAPALGRTFAEDDAHEGADAVIVLSDAVWRSRFEADPAVIGRSVRFADRTYTVIGVMPRGFVFPDATTDAWRPYVMSAGERAQSESGNVGDLDVVARLAPGVGVEQARERLAAIFANDDSVAGLLKNAGLKADARAWRERFAAKHWQALGLLQLAALILLAVVAANLINLMLDRLLSQAREFAIRRALGADEGMILRGIVADLLPPVIGGLAFGLALTPFGLHLAESRGLLPENLPQGAGFGIAAAVAGVIVALLALSSGVVAAIVSRQAARLSSRAGIAGLGRVRPAMLVGQVMLTTALLGSAGLLLRSAVNLVSADRGFDETGVLLTAVDPVGVSMSGKRYDPARDHDRFMPIVEELRADIASLPGVEHAAIASAPPFSGWEMVSSIRVPGQSETSQARDRQVGHGYFAALGTALTAGREFEPTDAGGDGPVVVDELYRQRYLQGVDPLAAYVEIPLGDGANYRKARIVGVVRTIKHENLEEAVNLPTIYRFTEAPLPIFWLVTRTSTDPAALAETVRQRILARAPATDIGVNKPLAELVATTIVGRRSLLEALGGFAAVTLLLAGLGLAAVLSFAIRRRTAELGVRMAIGATPARVRNLVMRQGGVLIAIGAVLGLVVGLPLARLLADRLYGIAFTDPLSWLTATMAVIAVAAFACWLPARRAAATDPIVALRSE
jgi:putative ABC transport system permease protein